MEISFHLTLIPEFPEFFFEWFTFRKLNNFRDFLDLLTGNFGSICPRFENFKMFGRMVSAHRELTEAPLCVIPG